MIAGIALCPPPAAVCRGRAGQDPGWAPPPWASRAPSNSNRSCRGPISALVVCLFGGLWFAFPLARRNE